MTCASSASYSGIRARTYLRRSLSYGTARQRSAATVAGTFGSDMGSSRRPVGLKRPHGCSCSDAPVELARAGSSPCCPREDDGSGWQAGTFSAAFGKHVPHQPDGSVSHPGPSNGPHIIAASFDGRMNDALLEALMCLRSHRRAWPGVQPQDERNKLSPTSHRIRDPQDRISSSC